MKRLKSLFFILVFIIFTTSSAFGCLCHGPKTLKEARSRAESVFSGELVAVKGEYDFTFKVDNVWKGFPQKQIVVRDTNAGSDCATAKYIVGERYLLFAVSRNENAQIITDDENNPILSIIMCSWTISLKEPWVMKQVVKKLGKGRPLE